MWSNFQAYIHKLQARLENLPKNKHSSLLGPFVSYEENKVLWKRPLIIRENAQNINLHVQLWLG